MTPYTERRGQIETYFDRTAAEAWRRLTSDVPVSGIRATVRAGRDRMREVIMSWLPADMTGLRLLDAGCGTGALAVEAARRGATVVAIDLSPNLVAIARDRLPANLTGHVEFQVGDMLDPALGRFDHAVAMDSLIHYDLPDAVRALTALGVLAERSVIATFAPRTPMLALMHAAGRLFPRSNRAPSIVPVAPRAMRLAADGMAAWRPGRTERVASGFYTSQAQELLPR